MKLDTFTQSVLSNFSSINNSIVINKGNEIRTMSENKTILAEAKVTNSFDRTFGIYDLRKLIGCLGFGKNTEISLEDKYLEVISDSNKIRYMYTDPSRIVTPTKRLNLSSSDVSFVLLSDTLNDILRACNILSVEDVSVTSEKENEVIITVLDKSNPTTNSAIFVIPATCNTKFQVYVKVSNLKIISDDYDVKISLKGISLFSSKNHDLLYYIAVESDSKTLTAQQ